jgi:hypothetical protein
MVWKARQSEMIAKVRAQAQAAIGGDKAVEAFSEFRDTVNRVEIKARTEKMRDQLEKLKNIKEIRFRPLSIGSGRSGPSLRTINREDILPKVPPEHQLRPLSGSRKR